MPQGVRTYHGNIFKVHTVVGTRFLAVIAYHRVGAHFAFWSWVAGAVAGCRCRVLLQGAAVRMLFALWSLVLLSERFGAWLLLRCKVLLQSAAAECRCWCCCGCTLARCCPGCMASFHFPLHSQDWWVGMSLGLVLAASLFALRLRWCCEQHKQQKKCSLCCFWCSLCCLCCCWCSWCCLCCCWCSWCCLCCWCCSCCCWCSLRCLSCCCWLWPAPRRNPTALRPRCIMTPRARAQCFVDFRRWFQRKKCRLTARARNVSLFSVASYDLRNSSAPAMNHCKKHCSWCDFSGVMCLLFFTALATQDVPSAVWCELSRHLVINPPCWSFQTQIIPGWRKTNNNILSSYGCFLK